jgi:hypothetical protein
MLRSLSLLGFAALTLAAVAYVTSSRSSPVASHPENKNKEKVGNRLPPPAVALVASFHAPFSLN